MVNQSHLKKLEEGVEAWNAWRKENQEVKPDLRDAILKNHDLRKANLSNCDLRGARLSNADLGHAYLAGADLRGAELYNTHLYDANLSNAKVCNANLYRADLSHANLMGANLRNADLRLASLVVETNVQGATFTDCKVHGTSVWDLKGVPAEQNNLLITRDYRPCSEPAITVDNLEVAQFFSLLVEYEKRFPGVIDAIQTKVVLILGRFTDERKAVLDKIRDELRTINYIPILFDFERPQSKTYKETVITIANMAYFVIADFTCAKRVLDEVPSIVTASCVPIMPIQKVPPDGKCHEDITVSDLRVKYRTILPTYWYTSLEQLCTSLKKCVIDPANKKASEIFQEKTRLLGATDVDITRRRNCT
jgi:uncharacterized protein YjbI with pentapeptide repeats